MKIADFYLHFSDEEIEAQRGPGTYLSMHSKLAAEPGLEDGPSSAFYPSGPLQLGAGSETSPEGKGQEDHGRTITLACPSHISGLLSQKSQDRGLLASSRPALTQPGREWQASRWGYRPQVQS